MDIGSIIGAAPLGLGVLMALGGILVTYPIFPNERGWRLSPFLLAPNLPRLRV